MKLHLIAVSFAVVVVGCGKKEAPAVPSKAPAAQQRAAAEPERPKVSCPAKPSNAPAGPDVIGVRLGMAPAEALNVVQCESPQARITEVQAWVQGIQTHGQKLGTQMISAKSGDAVPCDWKKTSIVDAERCQNGVVWKRVSELVTIATPGAPGQEQVQGLWRTQRFAEGQAPTVAAAIAALQAKYGSGGLRTKDNAPVTEPIRLDWVRDAAGQTLSPEQPRYRACAHNITAWADGSQRWTADCGLSVAAAVVRSRTNPELASEVHVGVADQSKLMAVTEGLQAALDAMDAERKQRELKGAAETKVKL